MRKLFIIALLSLIVSQLIATEKRPLKFEDMFGMGRISDLQLSPDGNWIAYTLTFYSIEENNSNSDIWVVSTDGKTVKQMTSSTAQDNQPRWSPDGKKIAFVSTRDGDPQIFTILFELGEAQKLTNLSTGATDPVWSSDGKSIAFISEVFPDCDSDECNKKKLDELSKSKSTGILYDKLGHRQWNRWRDKKVSHLFIISSAGGNAKQLTSGNKEAIPFDLGSGHDVTFSPDNKYLYFVTNYDEPLVQSTNNDIFSISIEGGTPKKITDNPANDNHPIFSPNGNYLAYKAHLRPGYEADRFQLMLKTSPNGKSVSLTKDFDRSIDQIVWSSDSKKIFFLAEEHGDIPIFQIDLNTKKITQIVKGFIHNLLISNDSNTLYFTLQRSDLPAEIFSYSIDNKKLTQITFTNEKILNQLEMNPLEEFWFKGAENDKVQGFLVRPPKFDAKKKYPAVLLIHGGPQNAWGNDFHYRWNTQMFASKGYVVFTVNFHGSTGYGQAFTDSIQSDWGGKPFVDIMKGLDYVIENYKFVDQNRIGAAGASYGGYMINWIEGHSNRFKCLVCHDGVFNLVSQFGTTDELWFPEWEYKGTPWTNKELYDKMSPYNYALNFKTPMLVVHSQNDLRCDLSEGLQVFTYLQRLGIKSKFLYFSDESHFVAKPQNARLWWKTVHEWLADFLHPEK